MESANTRAVPELGRSVYGLSSAETIGSDLVRRLGALDLGALRAMDGETLTVAATRPVLLHRGRSMAMCCRARSSIRSPAANRREIGRESCRDRVCQYV